MCVLMWPQAYDVRRQAVERALQDICRSFTRHMFHSHDPNQPLTPPSINLYAFELVPGWKRPKVAADELIWAVLRAIGNKMVQLAPCKIAGCIGSHKSGKWGSGPGKTAGHVSVLASSAVQYCPRKCVRKFMFCDRLSCLRSWRL
jgi:hypothetical protein